MENKEYLNSLDVDVLKQELRVRGAATHASMAAAMLSARKNLGGNIDLAQFSSTEIAEVLFAKEKAIYGVDDRKDLFEVTDSKVKKNAKGVVSLFKASRVRDNGNGTSTLQVGQFGKINSLCTDEPFFSQPVGAFCTGFLVAPDIIATAGHCVDEKNVTTIRFVFGFQMLNNTQAQVIIDNNDIYAGESVIGRQFTEGDTDWCLVKLDRKVSDKQILTLRKQGKIADNQSIYVLGHPSGLSLKFADGANVRTNTKAAFFTANLDTYGGNSGSPVFNSNTHEVEGVLVRGTNDFVPLGLCMVSAVCPTTGCEGEDCTRVSEFIQHL